MHRTNKLLIDLIQLRMLTAFDLNAGSGRLAPALACHKREGEQDLVVNFLDGNSKLSSCKQ